MPWLDHGIHAAPVSLGMDCRIKSGNDDSVGCWPAELALLPRQMVGAPPAAATALAPETPANCGAAR